MLLPRWVVSIARELAVDYRHCEERSDAAIPVLDCFASLAMTEAVLDSLVSTEWLAGHLGEPDLVVVDSSWHMPSTNRSGHQESLKAHIPGARFLDIEAVSDRTQPAPHMLPHAEEFGRAMEEIGVGRDDRIVVYDN